MPNFKSPAIVLRRIDFGDYDFILTFFTLKKGKISAIAKSAKRSVKRFGGILELFSILEIVCTLRNDRELMVLQEADLKNSFSGIRADLKKTAYASYFVEIVNEWTEPVSKQEDLYFLLGYVLEQIDSGSIDEEVTGILFLIRFVSIAGISPNLWRCCICRTQLDDIKEERVGFDFSRSGIVCFKCSGASAGRFSLTKGTIKQLLWIESGGLEKALKIKFNSSAVKEGLELLETFTSYHLGKEMQSLKFLKQLRKGKGLWGD